MRIRLATVVKMLGFVLGGLMTATAALGLLVWVSFDAGEALNTVSRQVQERYDRTLRSTEPARLSLWPWPAVTLREVSLSEANHAENFAKVATVRAELALLPLLTRRAQIRRIELEGLECRLVRNRDGAWNVSDLLSPSTDAAGKPEFPRLEGLKIAGASVTIDDQRGGRNLNLQKLSLEAGSLRDGISGQFQMQAEVTAQPAGPSTRVQVASRYMLRTGLPEGTLDYLRATADGAVLGLKTATLNVAIDHLGWSQRGQTGDVTRASLKLGGEKDGRALELTAEAPLLAWRDSGLQGERASGRLVVRRDTAQTEWLLSIPTLTAQNNGFAGPGTQLKWQYRSGEQQPASAELSGLLTVELSPTAIRMDKIKGELKRTAPRRATQTPVTLEGAASWRADSGSASALAEADLTLRSASDSLRLNAQLRQLLPLGGLFRLESSRLDLDRLLGRSKDEPASPVLPLSALEQADLKGQLKLANLRSGGLTLESLQTPLEVAGGRLVANGFSIGLYGGSLDGDFSAELGSGKIATQGHFQSLALERIASDSGAPLPLTGALSGSYELAASSRSTPGVLPSLSGAVRWTTTGGGLQGVDLARSLRDFRPAILAGKAAVRTPARQEATELAAASSRFVLAAGQLRAERIDARNRWTSLVASGSADLLRGEMDFGLVASVQAALPDLADLRGKSIPLRMQGSLRNPALRFEPVPETPARKKGGTQ